MALSRERLATITEILRQELGEPELQVSFATNLREIARWDSLHHLRIVVALEDRFAVRFGDDELLELTSVASIATALERHLP